MASNGSAPLLLGPGDPAPAIVVAADGRSPFLLIGDHAGDVIPSSLGDLGLGDADRARHIAVDIGVRGLGLALSALLDATFVRQAYSRLVVDCNRAPDAVDATPAVSDGTPVPGNQGLTPQARAARLAAIHAPYQQAIADLIAERAATGRETVLVSLHSFTPALRGGAPRPWKVGVLHDGGDPAFARRLLAVLARDPDLVAGDNEPYRMDLIDYTVPRHAYPARLPYAEIEVRQDLLADESGRREWAARLAEALAAAR